MSEPWRALIIGCGNIAGGYNTSLDDPMVLTHALAYRRHPDCVLSACVDPDPRVRRAFAARWGVPRTYETVDEALSAETFDLVSVCTPTGSHLETLRKVLEAKPRAVLAEKPLDGSPAEARRLGREYTARGIPVAVNFTRRFDPSMRKLRERISAGTFGKLRAIVGWYDRGAVNNGSHLIDLVIHLTAGEPRIAFVGPGGPCGIAGDTTATAALDLDGVPFQMIGAQGADATRFELELWLEHAVIAIEEGGLVVRERPYIDSPAFPDERVLDRGTWQATRYGEAIVRAVDELVSWQPGRRLSSDIESAAASIEIACAIRDRALEIAT
jgi:predicted dehydrogenase